MTKVSTAFEEGKLPDSLAIAAADLHLNYVKNYPEDTINNPDYYYKAAQLLTDADRYDRALAVVNRFLARYPDHELAPYVLHFKGYFIYEGGLRDYPKARRVYLDFLDKYPEHENLTDVVLFSLEHLGKEEHQILDEILKKREENPQ